jgi:prevent-host-death family protein
MKIASVADVKAHFSEFLRATRSGPVIITKNGRPSAVLLPIESEAELERLILAYSPRFREIVEQSKQSIDVDGGLTHEAFWEEAALATVESS